MPETKKLAYESYLTGPANPAGQLPMIVLLHFMGSNPNQLIEFLFKDFDCPARVIAPYGQYRYKEEYSWLPDSLYDESEKDQGKFIDEITGLLLENVESWRQEFATRGKPIYLGVSQGGDICLMLASRYGDRYQLCLPIAGRLLVEDIIGKKNAGIVRIHHGVNDPIVPIAGAREAAKQLLAAGINVELREYENTEHIVHQAMRKAIHDDIRAIIGK